MSKILPCLSTINNIPEAEKMDFVFHLDCYRASFLIFAFTAQTVCFYVRLPHRHELHNMKAIAEKHNDKILLKSSCIFYSH